MKLSDEEKAMLAGDFGYPKQWAIDHQIKVGKMFDAQEMVLVNQAHMMIDPESVGDPGVAFLENLVKKGARVVIPMITDPRGVDLNYYKPLGQSEKMANIERRIIKACEDMGILMTNSCVNYQSVMPPIFGEHVAFGDTGVVIYSNSVCGAKSNFEGGPSALAAGLTGRTPKYGLHLDENRKATRKFLVSDQPSELTDWGILGAVIGKATGSYWEVPLIEGLKTVPSSDELKHFGAAMASFGSIPLFHLSEITPEARNPEKLGSNNLVSEELTSEMLESLKTGFGAKGDKVDVVVFAAPQLSLIEMQQLCSLCVDKKFKIPVIVCTSPQVYSDALRMKIIEKLEICGAKVLEGTCFYNQYAREIGKQNGWVNLLSNSTKIVNILGGYGYKPALASMKECVNAALVGEMP